MSGPDALQLLLGRVWVEEHSIDNPSQWAMAAWLQVAAVAVSVVILRVPLGNYMASVYADTRHWRLEKLFHRLMGAQPDDRQRWTKYCTSVLAFSAISVLFLYGLLLVQTRLPQPWGHGGMTPALAFNAAISFVTNTSWQNYPGETALGHVGLLAGLGVQAFVSCAVGMSVAVALIRGLSQYRSEQIGNFWVDLMRTVVRILIPFSIVVTLILLARGGQQFAWCAGRLDPDWRQKSDYSWRPRGHVEIDQADVG